MSNSPIAFVRPQGEILARRLHESRRFLQAGVGPRQVGKTTLVQQVVEASGLTARYASADEPSLRSSVWIEQQWEAARLEAQSAARRGAVLVLDEVHKLPGWRPRRSSGCGMRIALSGSPCGWSCSARLRCLCSKD